MKKYPFTMTVCLLVSIMFIFNKYSNILSLHSLFSNEFNIYQLYTYPFIHANILHYSINILMFYVFSKYCKLFYNFR